MAMTISNPAFFRGRLIWWISAICLIAATLFFAGERWARSSAAAASTADARQLANANASYFGSELARFRLLPIALAEYPDVAGLLKAGGDNQAVNLRLESLARKTNAAAIYVIGPDGTTLASSNHRSPASFVGQNYSFRPYFRDSMAKGDAELFALGTVSGQPGLYLARRVDEAGRPLGVIVVKVELNSLAKEWSQQRGISLIADRHGVVILSSRVGWQFLALRNLNAAERVEIAASRQFDGASLRHVPFDATGAEVAVNGETFRTHSVPVSLSGGQLLALAPMRDALDGARAQARIVGFLVLFGLLLIMALQFRQWERAAIQGQVQRELEAKVAERTEELEKANQLLVIESKERAASEQKYRQSREDLAQANRLGTLGQVTAGVAHEINQPVAAIRAFAENALSFLERQRPDRSRDNLRQIIGLTERIAVITGELRGFARLRTPAIGPTSLSDAIDAALLLVKHRIAACNTRVKWNKRSAAVVVRADRIRLEQVFVNLIQNSLDALGDRHDGQIEIMIDPGRSDVVLVFADNGPGLPEAMKPRIFTPFITDKDQGLGLGLAIVRDIVREFGGEIQLLEGAGARFELRFARP